METFVVRVWVGPSEPSPGHGDGSVEDTGGPSSLRGVVEHIRSGGSRSFGRPDELVEFLRRVASDPPARPDGGS